MFDGKKILITGGTGSLGRSLIQYISEHYEPAKFIIYSRDEYKQHQMDRTFNQKWLRYFLGDVRDLPRLRQVCRGVNYVVHAAALKQIPKIEYNPTEAIKTNIDGTANVVEACLAEGVEKAIFISTDKAVDPINFYGATKMVGEKLWISANAYNKTVFSAVRYGNVLASRGSVIELFLSLRDSGLKEFPITDKEMTRFWITLREAAKLVMMAVESERVGVFVPRLPSMKVLDIAKAIDPTCVCPVIGVRPGEKMHESLISKYDKDVFPVLLASNVIESSNGEYTSDANGWWLTADELRRKIGL